MKTFEEFELTPAQISFLKKMHAREAIKKYVKKYGVAPDDVSQFFTYTQKEYDIYKRIFYANYVVNSVVDDSPNVNPPQEDENNYDLTEITYSNGLIQDFNIDGTLVIGSGLCPAQNVSIVKIKIGNTVDTISYLYDSISLSNVLSIEVSTGNKTFDSRNNCNAIIETSTNTLLVGCKNTIIPDTIITIGKYAFYALPFEETISIPNSVKTIKNGAFCSSRIKSIVLPNSIETLEEESFLSCRDLNTLVFSNSLTYIGDGAFQGCYNLQTITIPNSVTYIGNSAFYGCSGLESVTVPNSITNIGNNVFGECHPTSVHLGIVGKDMFFYSKPVNTLMYATIDEGVEIIEIESFYNSGLKEISIPSSVTHIGNNAFTNCNNLTDIIYNGTRSQWNEIEKGSRWLLKEVTVHCLDETFVLVNNLYYYFIRVKDADTNNDISGANVLWSDGTYEKYATSGGGTYSYLKESSDVETLYCVVSKDGYIDSPSTPVTGIISTEYQYNANLAQKIYLQKSGPQLIITSSENEPFEGNSDVNLLMWQDGSEMKTLRFNDCGNGTYELVTNISGPYGILVRKYMNWNVGSKFGSADSNGALTENVTKNLMADGYDMSFTGNGRYKITLLNFS